MITFKVPSELYGVTDCVITDIDRTLKTGYAPCGDGCDYKLTADELQQLARIKSGDKIEFTREVFTRQHIIQSLQDHPLVKLKEKPLRVFIVGSFVKGKPHKTSDIDVLIEVKRKTIPVKTLENKYRNKIRQHFIKHGIAIDDSQHPQYKGRRIDLYFTYDANAETDKIEVL